MGRKMKVGFKLNSLKCLFTCIVAVGLLSIIAVNTLLKYQQPTVIAANIRTITSRRKLWPFSFLRDQLEEAPAVSLTTNTATTTAARTTMVSLETEEKCRETSNFVFIKTHKTGSTTLRSLTSRFGYFRNLSFLLGKGSIIGHLNSLSLNMKKNAYNFLPPIGVKVGDFSNYRNYNISNIHVQFDEAKMRKLMYPSPDLKYITIFREPVDQWLSNFQYYKGYKKAGLTLSNMSQQLLPFLKSEKAATLGFNKQLRDVGIGSKILNNGSISSLNASIAKLDNLLSLALITEYFDESLLVMKKLFCWSFRDILYVKKRAQPNPIVISDETRQELRRRSWADVVLYEHFLSVLWQRVEEYGPNFQRDLQTFRNLLNDTLTTCVAKSVAEVSNDRYLYIETYPSSNSSAFCWAFVNSRFHMDVEMVRRQGHPSDVRWKKLDY
ncbi:galactose-3-O-sulfotransferase 3-like isoform X1 [Apostichopus japonicus]|uniref:galactose-3-O-sulfotransferase 3-like isoform X1 n=1 Tax=Stichopus japonicus TaxID=307972 RepID=UPI003AB12DF5